MVFLYFSSFIYYTFIVISDIIIKKSIPLIFTKFIILIRLENLIIVSPQNYLKSTTINNFELKELQQTIFKNGKLVYNDPTIEEKRVYCDKEMAKIYPEVKRTRMPHEYYVDGTKEYVDFKNDLILKTKKLADIKL